MTPEDIERISKKVDNFLSNITFDRSLITLYDHIPGLFFFIKDINSKLITCNSNMLSMFRQKYSEQIYGKTGFDFFPANLVFSFIDDDRQVMEKDMTIRERIELNIAEDGSISWFTTTKTPLHDKDGKVIGLAGITRNIGKADKELHPYSKMIRVIDFLQQNYKEDTDIDSLAELCHLSKSQFHRTFKKLFRMPPLQFVLKLRIQSSIKLLKNTDLHISEIAYQCGFNDQNYFARSFSKACGMSPTKFRQKFR